ncbi:hypothetical protein ABZ383_33770 [Streptomyces sp. NPDC005900]|uniref:hypothetical protein n=1 Tax=Streptomyces sp. NPDC005900 TaxID=3154569 RepID=UPI0033CB5235
MLLDHNDDARRRRSRLAEQAFTSRSFETRVKYLATSKGVSLPAARGLCRLWDRLERENGSVDPQALVAAVLDACAAGEPWAGEVADAYRLRSAVPWETRVR